MSAKILLVEDDIFLRDGIKEALKKEGYSVFTAEDCKTAKAEFVILNPIAMVSPIKLQDYKIHDNPPGISGWLVEGRIRYDAFVLNNKADAISVCVAP